MEGECQRCCAFLRLQRLQTIDAMAQVQSQLSLITLFADTIS
jgi:hypothetical protein